MARDRTKNRERVRHEKELDRKNAFGVNDPTAYEAVKRMIKEERRLAKEAG